MSFYRQLGSNISPQKPGFDQWSIYVRFVANKIALAEVFLRVRQFSFSVSLKQCSILIFFYKLLLRERKIDEVWGPLKKQCFCGNRRTLDSKARPLFRRVPKIAKIDCYFHDVCLHGTTRLPLTKFHEILYLRIFPKDVQKIQVLLKSDKNNG